MLGSPGNPGSSVSSGRGVRNELVAEAMRLGELEAGTRTENQVMHRKRMSARFHERAFELGNRMRFFLLKECRGLLKARFDGHTVSCSAR